MRTSASLVSGSYFRFTRRAMIASSSSPKRTDCYPPTPTPPTNVACRGATPPQLPAAFSNNPYLAEWALAKLERAKEWAGRWGAPRQDIQNGRQIVGAGKGWIDRIEAALKDGSISLPAATALLAGTAAMQREGAGREGP